MGTRADFYVVPNGKTRSEAKWLGSVGWDGYEWVIEDEEQKDDRDFCLIVGLKPPFDTVCTETEFQIAVNSIQAERDDFTHPDEGWPWPWNNSGTTDLTYWFENGKVHAKWFDIDSNWPDMSHCKNVAWDNRSGLMIIGGIDHDNE